MIDIAGAISTVENVAGDIKIAFNDAMILYKVLPQIHADAKAGKPLVDILGEMEPQALAVIESIANVAFPGAGSAIGVLAYVVSNSKPLIPGSPEETRYFDKATGQGF